MIRWLVDASLKLRFMIIVLAAVLMISGVSQLRSMPVDVYPEFDPPIVEIQTEALGLSAAEMEALLTTPLEADLLNGVAWLDQIYSETVAGMSSILLIFEPGTDPIKARQMVQERLTQTFALPNVSSPPTMLQPLSTTRRAMMVGISSDELSLLDLGVLARWTIKPRLMGVPGVANVAVWGHRDRQLQVLVDPERLAEHDISLRQIIDTTGEALWVSPLSYLESSSPGTAGWIDTPNQRLTIRHELPISSAEDLAKVSVNDTDGLLLGDVADIVEDHQPLIGDAALNNQAGLMLVIEKFPDANMLEVTRGVEKALAAMAPGLSGVEIDNSIYRPANYIESAIGNIGTVALVGAVLLLLVLALFFFDWRMVLISFVTIPLSLIAAGYVLYLRGETFNTMTLIGLVIALGVIIDNAIVDVDNISRHLRRHRQSGSDEPTLSIVFEAVMEMRNALLFALMIILSAVLPIFFIPGLTGAFFLPLATSYVLALIASMAVAVIVTPALSLIVLGETPSLKHRISPLVSWLQHAHERMLTRAVQSPNRSMITAGVVILVGLLTLPFLNLSLQPSLKQTELLIEWQAVPGTSRTEMNRIIALATEELQSLSGVRDVGSHVGRAITGDAVVSINSGELWISIDPAADYDATVTAVREIVDGYPGLIQTVDGYRPERTAEALTGRDEDLVVRIYGDNLNVLYDNAKEIARNVVGIDGVAGVKADRLTVEPQLEIEVNLAAAEENRIKPGDVRRQATTLLSGLRVGNLYEEQKVYDVVVWGVPGVRNNLTTVHELLINTPEGQVPLGELADIRIVPAPIVIKRDVVSRFADIAVTVGGRDIAAVAADITNLVQAYDFPLEYHAEVLGAATGEQETPQRIISIVVATVIGIFLLMQASFNNWSLAFAGLITVPMALTGGAVAVLLTGGTLSIGSLFGFFTVFGIAIRNSILLISRFRQLELQEGKAFGLALVLQGAGERMPPMLLVALATGLAFLPLLFGSGAGFEILKPMAVVILGGLVTSMLLNLLVMPSLYLRHGFSPEPEEIVSVISPVSAAGTD